MIDDIFIPVPGRLIAIRAAPHEFTFFSGKWRSWHKEWHCVTPPGCDRAWFEKTVKENLPGEYRDWRYVEAGN